MIPKETVMAGSLWAEAVSKGRKEGAVAEARAFCIKLAREHHPAIADRLHEWGLQASRLPDPEFLRLVTEQGGSTLAGGAPPALPARRSESGRRRAFPSTRQQLPKVAVRGMRSRRSARLG